MGTLRTTNIQHPDAASPNIVLTAGGGVTAAGLVTGKVLQVVRATDSTDRTTTSTSFVDITGLTVTITPLLIDSKILILFSLPWVRITQAGASGGAYIRVTDSAGTAISGGAQYASELLGGTRLSVPFSGFAYDTPGSLSAKTYKMQFMCTTSSTSITSFHNPGLGQIFAIEVAA